MTAFPVPLRPLTAAEYAALPEDSDHDYELRDGHSSCRPTRVPRHRRALLRLVGQLRSQIPADRGLTACHLGGPFGYVDEPPITGVCTTQHPFPARVDLGALT